MPSHIYYGKPGEYDVIWQMLFDVDKLQKFKEDNELELFIIGFDLDKAVYGRPLRGAKDAEVQLLIYEKDKTRFTSEGKKQFIDTLLKKPKGYTKYLRSLDDGEGIEDYEDYEYLDSSSFSMIRHSWSQNRISLNIKTIYEWFGSDQPETIVTHGSVRPCHVIEIWQTVDDDAWDRDNIAKRHYFTRATMFGWSVGRSCHGEPFQTPGPINAMEGGTFSIKLQPHKKVYPFQIDGGDT